MARIIEVFVNAAVALAMPNVVNQKQSMSPSIWLIAILAILGLGAPLIRSSGGAQHAASSSFHKERDCHQLRT